jgi:hypothetical protein
VAEILAGKPTQYHVNGAGQGIRLFRGVSIKNISDVSFHNVVFEISFVGVAEIFTYFIRPNEFKVSFGIRFIEECEAS